MATWTVEDSAELYRIRYWGQGFFDIDDHGHFLVRPDGPEGPSLDVYDLVEELGERGIDMPVLLRFPAIVARRLRTLAVAFQEAFVEYEYEGRYRGVYPIKVNQQAHLVRDLVKAARPFHFGLEAGSKPELLICLAFLDDPEALILCNGYKDTGYIETALLAQRLGRNPVIVIEKSAELPKIIEISQRLGIKPRIGVRAKLSRPGEGRWESSSGDKAKFGLTALQMVELVDTLKANDMLDCLQLLHFHIGSQVTAIRTIKAALREAARTYTELCALGAPMGMFDVGGGLGVDYDGSRTRFHSSMNYSEEEYARDVVHAIELACDAAGLKHPDIVTECGRAMVAYSSVLVFDVVGVEKKPLDGPPIDVSDDDPEFLRGLREVYDEVNALTYTEGWHDALQYREEALVAYNLGVLSLRDRARQERLFWQVCGRIHRMAKQDDDRPEDLDRMPALLADTYYCNFSVFQSVPDTWAIGQLFPILPIHRLDERPDRRGVIVDLTCDSDGKIDKFIARRDVKRTLELHPMKEGEPYILAIPLVGAYQEILGDLHNLFGDTNAVHVHVHDDDKYDLTEVIEGDIVEEVLGYVQYDKKQLVKRVRDACETAIKAGTISRREAGLLLRNYQDGLDGYTYLGE